MPKEAAKDKKSATKQGTSEDRPAEVLTIIVKMAQGKR